MSVKMMTPQQIRDDLDTVALTWPDGIPWEQADRVNALKGELKRRGEEPWVLDPRPKTLTVGDKDTDALEKELRALSTRPQDDADAQKRFAAVRDELRRRAKETAPAARSPLPAREIEMPADVDVGPPKQLKRDIRFAASVGNVKEADVVVDVDSGSVTKNRFGQVTKSYDIRSPKIMCNIFVQPGADPGTVEVSMTMRPDDLEEFIHALKNARDDSDEG